MPISLIPTNLLDAGYKYCGVAPFPHFLSKGCEWLELDSKGNIVQDWYYSGNYWVTKQLFSETISSLTQPSSATISTAFSAPSGFNLFLDSFNVHYSVTTDSVAPNFFQFELDRFSDSGSKTILASVKTIGTKANVYTKVTVPLLLHNDLKATKTAYFKLSESRLAGNLSRTSTTSVTYRLVRI